MKVSMSDREVPTFTLPPKPLLAVGQRNAINDAPKAGTATRPSTSSSARLKNWRRAIPTVSSSTSTRVAGAVSPRGAGGAPPEPSAARVGGLVDVGQAEEGGPHERGEDQQPRGDGQHARELDHEQVRPGVDLVLGGGPGLLDRARLDHGEQALGVTTRTGGGRGRPPGQGPHLA